MNEKNSGNSVAFSVLKNTYSIKRNENRQKYTKIVP